MLKEQIIMNRYGLFRNIKYWEISQHIENFKEKEIINENKI